MPYDLGFLDDACPLLESRFFPSKIGGQPAWLDLEHIPSSRDLICNECGIPRQFLCQLYCPIEGNEAAFHRTIFVFLCLTKRCFRPNNGDNFIVYRCQLPLNNAYYPDTPPEDDIHWRPDINCNKYDTKVCLVCGLRGHVENDRQEIFCSEYHQKTRPKLLPECALRIEREDTTDDEEDSTNDEEDSEDSGSEFESEADDGWKSASTQPSQDDIDLQEIFKECSAHLLDRTFLQFKSRIADQPKQVIRYFRNGEPLWLSDVHQPCNDSIPVCEYCGGKREFEFQILPQLLNLLNLDKDDRSVGILDWGTLAIYTCKNNCGSEPSYKREFLWKQDLIS